MMNKAEQINNTTDYPEINIESESLEIVQKLGEGGTKTVYEVILNGENIALSIPNFDDPSEIRAEKWAKVEKEPENTAFLREKGLLVNPLCELRKSEINGEIINCLVSLPFSKLPFEVYDGKDGTASWDNGPLDFIESPEKIPENLEKVADDIKTLTDSGVILKSDSISFAIKNHELRLFLFDLDDMQVDESFGKKELASSYANIVTSKLDNLFSFSKFRALEQGGYTIEKRREIAENLANQISN